MSKNEKTDLEKALDESLEELQKAADGEEISKAAESEEVKGEKPAFLKKKEEKDEKEDEDKDAKGDEKDEQAEPDGDEKEDAKGDKKDEDKDEDEDEEAMRGGYRKSAEDTLSKSDSVHNAIEVSKFLRELVKSQAEILGDVLHRVRRMEKSSRVLAQALVKSQQAQADVIKSFGSDMTVLGKTPLPRKSVAVASIEKSFRNNEGGDVATLTKSEIATRLAELECQGKAPMGSTTKFEMGGELHKSLQKMVTEFEK